MTEAEHELPPATTASRGGLGWKGLLKAAVSIALLAVLLTQTDLGRLWAQFRNASPVWLLAALLLYLAMIVASAWRWRELILAQHADASIAFLVRSYMVATFFNNFLPSNIGGDVIRIKDTVPLFGSKTVAASVVLLDRAIGLIGLLLIAALGETVVNRTARAALPVGAPLLWVLSVVALAGLALLVAAPRLVHRVLSPLRRLHAEWVDIRLQRLVEMFARFRNRPSSLVKCLLGAVVVQAILVAFYGAVAVSLRIPIPAAHLAVLVPLSFVVQMIPVSMNGFGVREATFTAYFRMLGLPIESALALSFLATATIMVFSISGAAAYAARR